VQSTTGSRGVRISGSNAGFTMFRGSVNGTGYPLHTPVSPSLPHPCVTVCHHFSTGLYNWCSVSTKEPRINTIQDAHIQGVTRLVDITAGGDFLGLGDQKSSYKHVFDFGRLRSHGHFLIPVHAVVWTASYGTSWQVMYSTWWLLVCGSCNKQLAQFTTERQAVLRPAVAFPKSSFKHRSIQIKGNFTKKCICIMLVYYVIPFIVNNRYFPF